jgi:wyosine [tRNA(Phe)-imidazoG37] synthetase (radical SAM superfamily)
MYEVNSSCTKNYWCVFCQEKADHDHHEKQQQSYLLNEAFFCKIGVIKSKKHHKEAYDTLFSAWNLLM